MFVMGRVRYEAQERTTLIDAQPTKTETAEG
jgi:hypothetical protein